MKILRQPEAGHCPRNRSQLFWSALNTRKYPPAKMEEKLRKIEVPIIVRVDKDEILFDLRTVAEDEFAFIIEGLKQITFN